ncbi:MAG: hypothetical protein NC829_02385 [Candidatus Omnitrophica bacterium]|nr:hypothetical protein [Candidatus Omnitrophota bacterium]
MNIQTIKDKIRVFYGNGEGPKGLKFIIQALIEDIPFALLQPIHYTLYCMLSADSMAA